MFEGSLVESRGLAVTRAQRWSAAGSAAFQLMLAAIIVVVPLMRPQDIKYIHLMSHLTAPPPPVRPPVPVRVATTSEMSSAPTVPQNAAQAAGGASHFPLTPGPRTGDDEPIGPVTNIVMDGGSRGMPSLGPGSGAPEVTVIHAVAPQRLTVSGGVSQGMLLAPIRLVYPQMAIATRTEGTVVVEALISKTGRIESAHVVSGPQMLRQAALAAVEGARYRAFLLSSEPVEVETTVTVVFKLGE